MSRLNASATFAATEETMGGGELILLVTAIPDHAETYTRMLQRSGYRAEVVSTGAAALEFATQSAPDLALIDVRLPDMNGWEVCRAIKDEPAAGALPIVILTAELSQACAESSANSGCHAWLARPTRAEDIVQVVEEVLALDAESPAPGAALLGILSCPACDSQKIRATLRISPIQYYTCAACGLAWRVETVSV